MKVADHGPIFASRQFPRPNRQNLADARRREEFPKIPNLLLKRRGNSMSARPDLNAKYHPEIAAGGYSQDDSIIEFYQRVMSVLPEVRWFLISAPGAVHFSTSLGLG